MRLAANRTYNVDKSHRNPLHFAAGSYRFQSLQRRRMALKSDIPVWGFIRKFLQDSYKFCTGAAMVDTTIPVNLNHKFSLFSEYWRPKVAAQLNGQEVKLVKFKGEFIWHHHDEQDEMFFVWKGRFRVDFRDHSVELHAGELLVVPRGIEHRTVAEEEVEVVIFEPAETRNTGNVADDKFTAPGGVSI
ncbi:MAG: cupin domain-containing protein [Bacteroidota bacterium]